MKWLRFRVLGLGICSRILLGIYFKIIDLISEEGGLMRSNDTTYRDIVEFLITNADVLFGVIVLVKRLTWGFQSEIVDGTVTETQLDRFAQFSVVYGLLWYFNLGMSSPFLFYRLVIPDGLICLRFLAVSRHRTLMNVFDKAPVVDKDVFVAPSASIIGDVQVGRGSSIWYGCVLRGKTYVKDSFILQYFQSFLALLTWQVHALEVLDSKIFVHLTPLHTTS